MSTQTQTQSQTFTVADIKRVLDNFAADFGMISQATGLQTREFVDNAVADLKEFAAAGYLKEIHLTLFDANGAQIRAARYAISTAAAEWISQLPGNNLWPRTPGGRLNVTAVWSQKYAALDEAGRTRFRQRLHTSWGPSSVDISHSSLVGSFDRHYVSNGWGLEKQNYQ